VLHVVIGATMMGVGLTAALVSGVTSGTVLLGAAVGGVGAWHLLRDRANPGARTMFSMAMDMAALVGDEGYH